jgi:PAS domain S-box-containing protein
VLAGCGIVLALAAWWYYTRQRTDLESSTAAELTAIADVKARQIANWRSERIGDGGVLSSALITGQAQKVLGGRTGSATDREVLRDVVRRFIAGFHYAGATVVDRKGATQLRVGRGQDDPGRYRAAADAAVAAGHVILSDLSFNGTSGQPWMLLTVPVLDAGAVILEIDPATFLYPYVNSWPTASASGESLLVRRDGSLFTYLSDGRFQAKTPLWRLGRGAALPRANFSGEVSTWTDYRGAPVIGVIRPVPDSEWYLAAKMDASEANAPLRRTLWELVLVVALIAAINAAGAELVWRDRQVKIYRDREAWFRQITNDTPAYLWITEPEASTCFINQRYAHFLGVSGEKIDFLWEEQIHPDDLGHTRAQLSNCLRNRTEYRDEFRVRRSDGEYRWMAVHGLPRYGVGGKFAGYAGALADITERREAERRLHGANEALASELQERTRSEQQVLALSARLINAQEEERARLARELHDDLSQQIAAVSIGLSNLKKKIPPESSEAIEPCKRIQQKLVNLAMSMRRLSHDLHPSILQHSGLAAALRNYCAELSELTGHRVAFRSEGEVDPLPAPVALCVYRVAQEALQNSIKHAQAEEAEVALCRADGFLRLVVADHGVGMRFSTPGLGLVSMRERTRLVNGSVEVSGTPGSGVTITLEIPVPPSEAASCAAATAGI